MKAFRLRVAVVSCYLGVNRIAAEHSAMNNQNRCAAIQLSIQSSALSFGFGPGRFALDLVLVRSGAAAEEVSPDRSSIVGRCS